MRYSQIRIALLTLTIGIASIPFVNFLQTKWSNSLVKIPEGESNTAIRVFLPEPPKVILKPQITKELIFQDRDLSLYEVGKTFLNYPVRLSNSKKNELDVVKARKFIWKHWKEKKRAYIISKWLDEGVSCDSHIFIEPDRDDEWKIVRKQICNTQPGTDYSQTEFRFIKFGKASEYDYEFKRGTNCLVFFEDEKDYKEFDVRLGISYFFRI